ncbi:S8 family serine peptidase [Corynebacterium lowii]|uniref:Subtilisin DY n=1 Tax=Corynebacterium lowii TaxID=1544413 RepID=A0A0N8W0R3_9CORY|nr:S8 family serine peptidase [Corynebacterium lowii]KQB87418.1 Subtilisin DY [Corynebacterium lowii]MDP9851992.1 membrane-anchored mycosin MYCP [Corynebacterium lowii]
MSRVPALMLSFAILLAIAPIHAAPLRAEERCVAGIPLSAAPPPPDSARSPFASGAGITVAVIDTGVAPHEQLTEVIPGSDLVSPEAPAPLHDCDGHGTIVAGVIGARDYGVAPGARILSIRQSSSASTHQDEESRTRGTLASLAQALREAVDRGARVINISVVACLPPERAHALDTTALDAALDHAERHGAVVIAAAGNRSVTCTDTSVVYPAYSPTVISVGALEEPHSLAPYSLPGGPLRLAAPGALSAGLNPAGPGWIKAVGIPDPSGFITSPQKLKGTSFAAPVVSGIAALLLERHPYYSPAQVRAHLLSAAQPPHGAITAQAAIAAVLPPPLPDRSPAPITLPGPPDSQARAKALLLMGLACVGVLAFSLSAGFTARYRGGRYRGAKSDSPAA